LHQVVYTEIELQMSIRSCELGSTRVWSLKL